MKNKLIVISIFILLLVPSSLYAWSKADAITLILHAKDYAPKEKTLVIIPLLTANAYKAGAFYDYYSGTCDKKCLTTTISANVKLGEAGSQSAWATLKKIGYDGMSDYIIDYYLSYKPEFLQQYHTIIMLHSEYVTQQLYNAMQAHPHVIYLAPNANYGLVKIDHGTMTLVSGHDIDGKGNAFGWEYDNTNLEQNKSCDGWAFINIQNGYQLNCNPELTIHNNFKLLKALQELEV